MKRCNIGGMAVFEGVMMKAPDKYAITVRLPDKKIKTETFPVKIRKISKIPFLRGIFNLCETIYIGFSALTYSTNESAEEEEKINLFEIIISILLAIAMTFLLFVYLPLVATGIIYKGEGLVYNLLDGLIRIVFFIAYLLIVSRMKDIKRMFEYHGAEHKTINCFESGKKLTIKNVKMFPTLHPRCGTSFLIIIMMISIIVFTLVPAETVMDRFLYRILLLPIIAGISYEFLKFSAKHEKNPIMRLFIWPGLMLQKITTKEPDAHQIETAICSLKAVL